MRNVPLLLRHYELNRSVPRHMATGFAAYLLYMKAVKQGGKKYFGLRDGEEYEIKDDSAGYFYELWKSKSAAELAETVMHNRELWETDLCELPGFLEAVQAQLRLFAVQGVKATVAQLVNEKVTA